MRVNPTQTLRLIGQPSLQNFLHFIKEQVIEESPQPRSYWVSIWKQANNEYSALEEQERNIANSIDIQLLPDTLAAKAESVRENPFYQSTFDKVATRFAWVELEKLVVSQLDVNRDYNKRLDENATIDLSSPISQAQLFDFCLPPKADNNSVDIQRISHKRYQFSSESSDFRPHNNALLNAEQINDLQSFGPVSAVFGAPVGFGSNFLTAIESQERLVLHNGYHRSLALLEAGIRYAPFIIQSVECLDELEICAQSKVVDDSNFYFGAARPPLLKDFLNPKLAKLFTVHRTKKVIEINIDVKEYQVRV